MSTNNKPQQPPRRSSQPPKRSISQPPKRTTSQPPQRVAASQSPQRTASQPPERVASQPLKRSAVSQPPQRISSRPVPQQVASQPPQRTVAPPPKREKKVPQQRVVSQTSKLTESKSLQRHTPQRVSSQSPQRSKTKTATQRKISQLNWQKVNQNIDFSSLAVKYLGLALGCLGLILSFFLSWLPEGLVSLAVAGAGVYFSYKEYKGTTASYTSIGGLFVSIAAITIIFLAMTTLGFLYKHSPFDGGNLWDTITQLSGAHSVFNRLI